MERDFLGIYSKHSAVLPHVVKEKSMDVCKNTGREVQWPFSSAVFSPVQYMPPKAAQDYTSRDFIDDFSTGSAFTHFGKPNCFTKKNTCSANTATSSTQNVATNHSMKQIKSQVGNPNSLSLFSTNGLTDGCGDGYLLDQIRNDAKSESPTPLTIFYSGSVHVYHDVSQAKAEAIMCIAGNGHSIVDDPKQASKSDSEEKYSNKKHPQQPSPTSKAAGPLNLARKATLARFLEKRKDRMTNVRPYNVSDQSMDLFTLKVSGDKCEATQC